MADELRIPTGTTGLTVTAIPFLLGVEQTPIAMTEIATYGVYQGDMTGAVGTYDIVFRSAGATVGYGSIEWDGTAEILNPTASEIATEVRTELATELAAIVEMLKTIKNKREIKKVGTVWTLFIYDDDGTTPLRSKELKDIAGNDITDIAAGLLAVEMASTI